MVFDGEGEVNRLTVAAPAQNVVKAEIIGPGLACRRGTRKGYYPRWSLPGHVLTRLPLGRIDEETTANIGYLEGGLRAEHQSLSAHYLDGEIRSRDQSKAGPLYGAGFREVFDEVARPCFRKRGLELDVSNSYRAYRVNAEHPTVAMLSRGADPGHRAWSRRLKGTGGGSDANVFFEHGIAALPVGIGVRSFHTKEETADHSGSAARSRNVPTTVGQRLTS